MKNFVNVWRGLYWAYGSILPILTVVILLIWGTLHLPYMWVICVIVPCINCWILMMFCFKYVELLKFSNVTSVPFDLVTESYYGIMKSYWEQFDLWKSSTWNRSKFEAKKEAIANSDPPSAKDA